MGECKDELMFYEELQKRQKRCEVCNGMGQKRHYTDVDESEMVICSVCKGSGDSNKGIL